MMEFTNISTFFRTRPSRSSTIVCSSLLLLHAQHSSLSGSDVAGEDRMHFRVQGCQAWLLLEEEVDHRLKEDVLQNGTQNRHLSVAILKCSISAAEPGPGPTLPDCSEASRFSVTGLCSTSFCSRSTSAFMVALMSMHWHPLGTCRHPKCNLTAGYILNLYMHNCILIYHARTKFPADQTLMMPGLSAAGRKEYEASLHMLAISLTSSTTHLPRAHDEPALLFTLCIGCMC